MLISNLGMHRKSIEAAETLNRDELETEPNNLKHSSRNDPSEEHDSLLNSQNNNSALITNEEYRRSSSIATLRAKAAQHLIRTSSNLLGSANQQINPNND